MNDFIKSVHKDNYTIVEILTNSWNIQYAIDIENSINNLLKNHDVGNLILDLNNIETIDSSSIGYLIKIQKQFFSDNKKIILYCKNETILMILKVVHLESLFTIVKSLQAAVKLLN